MAGDERWGIKNQRVRSAESRLSETLRLSWRVGRTAIKVLIVVLALGGTAVSAGGGAGAADLRGRRR